MRLRFSLVLSLDRVNENNRECTLVTLCGNRGGPVDLAKLEVGSGSIGYGPWFMVPLIGRIPRGGGAPPSNELGRHNTGTH